MRAQIHGVPTNRDLLVDVLQHPEFRAGRFDTAFLERSVPATRAPIDGELVRRHAIAAVLADREARRGASPLPRGIPAAWRNVGPALQPVTFSCGAQEVTIDATELDDADHRLKCSVHRVGESVYVDSRLGSTALREHLRFPLPIDAAIPGSLYAPMPGTVTYVAAGMGQVVERDEVLVMMEAMKMEHTLRAPHAGVVVEVRVRVGDQVDTGTMLAVVEPDA